MASFKQFILDDFGKVRIFNLAELLPALSAIAWFFGCMYFRPLGIFDLGILVSGVFVSGYLMFLRLISFVVGVTTMVSAFLPILKMLKENER
jgi:hypothetical protein